MGNLTAWKKMSIQNEMLSMEHGVGSGKRRCFSRTVFRWSGEVRKDQGTRPAVARDECRVARSTVREEGWHSGKV